jgi:hypothetical protein
MTQTKAPSGVRPALGLLFLSPLIAEYLLGNVPASALPLIGFLAPMYGCGAILVREVARHTGRGWRTMVPLAAAYGLLEAGLLDQSLFNPDYDGWDFQTAAHIAGIDVSGFYLPAFLVTHTVWSIGLPILFTETISRRRTEPWLRRRGLVLTAAVFVPGCWIIYADHVDRLGFHARPEQSLAAAAGVLLLIGVAFLCWPAGRPWNPPKPRLLQAIAFVATSAELMAPQSWYGAALVVGFIVASIVLIHRWSLSTQWTQQHRVGLAGGALLSYCWIGFVLLGLGGNLTVLNAAGQIVLVAAAILLRYRAVRSARQW